MDESSTVGRFTVDGALFVVEASRQRPGEYWFTWLSGPNDGYGFSSASSDGSAMSQDDLTAAIRDFLRQIDPNTGYLR